MELKSKRPIAILNLAEELSPELTEYFARKQILVVTPGADEQAQEWTHLLTKGVQDFSELETRYDTVTNDVRIISLSGVEDIKNFASSNGKLVLDEVWLQSAIGGFILDKFLQGYGGIALGDNFPTFKEKGSFNITNPFNTGEYLDRLVQSAYLEGMSGLSIKTFFDHLVMYLTGLKTKGKLGLPIEVAYGYFEDIFGVQMHFYTKDLILEDVTASLSGHISKRAEEYLLNVAIQSSDFFDFTLLSDVNKTVVTGLWSKDDNIKVENRGFLFNELNASAGITSYPTEGITSFQMSDSEPIDFSEKIILPGQVQEKETSTTVAGGSQEAELTQVIKGQATPREAAQVIHGSKAEADLINIIKGNVEKEEANFRISGAKNFDVDKFAFKVSAGIDTKLDGKEDLKLTSLKNDLPRAIKSSFEKFASQLNKTSESISDEDLRLFKDVEVPKLIKERTLIADGGEAKLLLQENEGLKGKIKVLMTELKVLKDSKAALAQIKEKALSTAEAIVVEGPTSVNDGVFKSQMLKKIEEKKPVNDQEIQKLAKLIERETLYLTEAKQFEINLKKLQIENTNKESFFSQELEKLNRMVKAKELIVVKTKEGLTKLIEQKDSELLATNEKLTQISKALSSSQSQNNMIQIRELERKVSSSEKMIEILKGQIAQKPATKTTDDGAKEENRRLVMLTNQMKNQLEVAKKEVLKSQEKIAEDLTAMNALKADKVRLEQLLKKAILDAKKEESAVVNPEHLEEVKKLQGKYELLDVQFKEGQLRQKDLEMKLQEMIKSQKKEVVVDEAAATRGKTAHLEGNVRKLTLDLVEARNQLGEMKKETNKLRQEKTALQNQIDKMKKDTERATKAAAPKKPVPGGKAA